VSNLHIVQAKDLRHKDFRVSLKITGVFEEENSMNFSWEYNLPLKLGFIGSERL
jgi:hypothetical protein